MAPVGARRRLESRTATPIARRREAGAPHTLETADMESMLLQQGLVTAVQLERTRRIAAYLARPGPPGEILVEMGQIPRTGDRRWREPT